jgi:uncharacterized protein YxeA
MKKIYKILFFLLLMLIPARICLSQEVNVRSDTLKVSQDKNFESQSEKQNQNMNQVQAKNKQQGNNTNVDGNQQVKQVKGARPDMSKARGARPPSIVRQAGSGIPKGIGKPGGVGKHGGR